LANYCRAGIKSLRGTTTKLDIVAQEVTYMTFPLVEKEPTRGTEWKWWEPPNKNLRSDPAGGENHNWNRIPPKRFYLDHRR
jgi:hypothetical protein